MAKPHKYAWNGLDVETSLSVESVANMAQRAAHESTGDVLQGKHRIVSVRSGDREIEFRINDYLISFNKLMVFLVALDSRGGRTYVSTTIDWYMTSQTTVNFIPVSTKKMVAHHTYMQFVGNLAQQIRAADPTARIALREGLQAAGAPPASAQPAAPAPSAPPAAPGPAPSHAVAPPPPPPAQAAAAARAGVIPPPPPPSALPGAAVPPPPPAPSAAYAPAPPAPAAVAPPPTGLVSGIPGRAPAVPDPPAAVPPLHVPAPPPVPLAPPGIAPQAAQLFADDDDLGATRAALSATGPRPWIVSLPDGRTLELSRPLVFGRAPVAPATAPHAAAVPIVDPRKSLSKTHAVLDVRDAFLWVTDLHSTNGTTVTNAVGEATSCPPGVPMPVGEGWTVSFGEVSLTARLAG